MVLLKALQSSTIYSTRARIIPWRRVSLSNRLKLVFWHP